MYDVFSKTLPPNVFDDVLQKAKHRTNDASNGVNRPPLLAVSLHYLMTTQYTDIDNQCKYPMNNNKLILTDAVPIMDEFTENHVAILFQFHAQKALFKIQTKIYESKCNLTKHSLET